MALCTKGCAALPGAAHGNGDVYPGEEAVPGGHERGDGLRPPGEKDQGPGDRPTVCHRGPLPGGQCLPGIPGHQAHLRQDEGHEFLPVRAILLPQRGGDIGAGPRRGPGVCREGLARLRGARGYPPGRRAPAFPLCGELRQLGDGSEAAAIPQDFADPPGPER